MIDPFTIGKRPCEVVLVDICSRENGHASKNAINLYRRFRERMNKVYLNNHLDIKLKRHLIRLLHKDSLEELEKRSFPEKIHTHTRLCICTHYKIALREMETTL